MNFPKTKVLIVEDERIASQELSSIIEQHFPDLDIVGVTESVKETTEWLTKNKCALIFMDISLSDGNAFDVFKTIKPNYPIIFTTAFNDYAIHAFKVNGIDYVLKPYTTNEIVEAVRKFLSTNVKWTDIESQKLMQLLKPNYMKRVSVKRGNTLQVYSEHDIAYFYAEGKYVFIVDKKAEVSVVNYTMDELDRELDPEQFFRINRKYIISFSSIQRMLIYDKYRIKIETTIAIKDDMIVSIDRALNFKKWINKV